MSCSFETSYTINGMSLTEPTLSTVFPSEISVHGWRRCSAMVNDLDGLAT
jgi:hypothetical protein